MSDVQGRQIIQMEEAKGTVAQCHEQADENRKQVGKSKSGV